MAGWTDERTEKLRADWAAGLSASQIAERMGGITRNSVIGKAHRLGLSGRQVQHRKSPSGVARAKYLARRPKIYDRRKFNHGGDHDSNSARLALINGRRKLTGNKPFETLAEFYADQDKRSAELAALEAMPEVEVELSNRRGVADIQDDQCRWPIGDPQRTGFHFCDRKKEAPGLLPYCKQHNARAFRPPQPKSYLPNVQSDSSRAIGDKTKSLEEFETMAVRR